jgi:predicted transcriptional regulator
VVGLRLKSITFKADPVEVKKLDQLAVTLKTNRSALIRRAIKELIEKYEKPVEGRGLRIL